MRKPGIRMADPLQPRKFSIPTVFGGRQEIACPICKHNEFLTYVPDLELAKKEGFRHVVTGVYGEDQLFALPVRFQHCANCGFILHFVIGDFKEGGST
jgi:hypothetical protein